VRAKLLNIDPDIQIEYEAAAMFAAGSEQPLPENLGENSQSVWRGKAATRLLFNLNSKPKILKFCPKYTSQNLTTL